MKRLIVTGPRQAAFEDVSEPECAPDGLLVKARVTAVSTGTEIRVYRAIPVDDKGEFLHERIPFRLPAENGYSMVGDVIAVGADVRDFAVGDRVFTPSPHKQFAAVAAKLAVKLPDDIADEHAVFLSILEVGHIALRRGNPVFGENVVLLGQGVIGLAALAYCRAFGLRTVTVDRDRERLRVSAEMGAGLALAADAADAVERAIAFLDGCGADVVVEAASTWHAIETGMRMAAENARIVVAARHTDKPLFNPVGHPHLGKKLTLLTSYGHQADGQRWDRRRSFALTLDLLSHGRLDIAPMITHRFRWDELPEVYHRLDRGETEILGAVVQW